MPAALVLAAAALAVGGSAKVDAALLAGLAPVEATLNFHGEVHHCSGPTLAAVVAKLGLPANETLRGAALQRGIMVHARDGYAVLFSLGELDPGTGAEPAIIATQCDGKQIGPDEGPYRLVLPNDKRPARSVRQVESIELR
jgi:hypothetical protein